MPYGDDIGVWGNQDAKGRLILTDPKGGSPTFGPWVDFPGVSEISVKGEVTSIEGEGDNEVWTASNTKMLSGKAMFSRESIEALKVLIGGASASSGSAPNQQTDWQDSADRLPRLELQWRPLQGDDASSSDVVRTLHNVQVTSWEMADKFGEASKPGFEFKATRRKSDGKRFTVAVRETGAALVEGVPDATPPSVTSSTPADNATAVPVTSTVSFVFGTNVDHVSASDPGSYFISNASTGSPVAFALAYTASTRTAVLTPSANLAAATKQVAGVTRGLKSANGVRLAAPHSIDFTTA